MRTKRDLRISVAFTNHKLITVFLDNVIVFISTTILYFALIFSAFNFGGNYVNKISRINEIKTDYSLNLAEGLDYQEYEKIVKDFYFNKYPNEITKAYNTRYNEEKTITHIYNIMVLNLPINPTNESYSTEYYKYSQKENGEFDTEVIAERIILENPSKTYYKNMSDLFYNAYCSLEPYLRTFNVEYNSLYNDVATLEMSARIISFLISIIIFYYIIPLTNKYGSTLIEKAYKLGHSNYINGYLVPRWKIALRPVIYFLIPFIGIVYFTRNTIIIFIIAYLALNLLILLVSKKNLDFADKILKMNTCYINESLLFKNREEEEAYFESEEGKKITDVDFVSTLENMDALNVTAPQEKERKL